MPSPESRRRGAVQEKNRKGKLPETTSSFHGKGSGFSGEMIPRRRTAPEYVAGSRSASAAPDGGKPKKFAKLLVKVTVVRSLGAVQVLMPPEATVEDLIVAALRQYVKEARRPVLRSAVPSDFDLHYSQFSLESLDRKEKLMDLGSRNFFLWPKTGSAAEVATAEGDGAAVPRWSEGSDAGDNYKVLPCFKFMDFLL